MLERLSGEMHRCSLLYTVSELIPRMASLMADSASDLFSTTPYSAHFCTLDGPSDEAEPHIAMQTCFLPDIGASLLIVRWNHLTMQLMPITASQLAIV